MKARIMVAVVCIPLLLVMILLLPTWVSALVVSALCMLAAHELTAATGIVPSRRIVAETMIMAALVPFWSWAGCPAVPAQTAAAVYLLVMSAELLNARLKIPFEAMATCVFGGIAVPYFLSALVRLIQQPDGRILILAPFLIAFVADGAALFTGMALGKRKLAPTISPKKTVEGMLGGFAGAVIGMLVFCLVLQFGLHRQVSYCSAVVLALCGAGVSVVGDLFFSCLKREKRIKDYGKLLPGHGGVLDRFDSVLFCAPVCELLLWWLPLLK